MKTCTACGCDKPPTEFYSGRGDCKTCKRAATNAYRATRPDYYAKKARAWELANPEKKRERSRAQYHKDVVASRARTRAQYEKHKPRKLAQNKAYLKAHPDQVSRAHRAWYLKNADAARRKTREHAKTHPAYYALKAAERRANKNKATPRWLAPDEKSAIAQMFHDAASRDTPHEVDHIIPLKGKTVCGLHVPWNLRVVPTAENRSKSNRLLEFI